MKVQSVFDHAFSRYGKVITGYDFSALLSELAQTEKPAHGTVYQPGDPALERLPVCGTLSDNFYGGMPIQIGYCNGSNRALNCLEYHRDSEVNVAADDIVLLLAGVWNIRDGKLDTGDAEAFAVPAGTAVQLYETTLHYAPCSGSGKDGFRVAVALPRGTNMEKPDITPVNQEDRMLWARNKWLLAHPDSNEAAQGAYVGLTGENITI